MLIAPLNTAVIISSLISKTTSQNIYRLGKIPRALLETGHRYYIKLITNLAPAMWVQPICLTHLLVGCLNLVFLTVDHEAVWPEEEAAGNICWGGRSWHGWPDKGMVSTSGATGLSHKLWWGSAKNMHVWEDVWSRVEWMNNVIVFYTLVSNQFCYCSSY